MRKIISILLIILIISVVCGCENVLIPGDLEYSADSPDIVDSEEIFYGEWIVTRCIPTEAVSMYSQEEIEQFIGQKVTYAKDFALFQDSKIKPYYHTIFSV